MFIGQENLLSNFKRLADKGELSHGYVFFGEPQVGKATFAKYLANYLEFGEFEKSVKFSSESFIISPDESRSIGIDEARDIKRFLSEKPANSKFRVVIIDDADTLTPQAQNAILKIAEEPPSHALIILIIANPDSILPTLQSRFQKIYFPRVKSGFIENFLIKEYKLTETKAAEISKKSFGRVGMAVDMISNEEFKDMEIIASDLLKRKMGKKELIADFVSNKKDIDKLLFHLIFQLSGNMRENYLPVRSILRRQALMSQFNTNKRLQLESALWNI
jgi:DNA polymerase-3 subunit delta'